MARGPASRGVNSTAMSINLRIAAICGGVAAAIMMGAVLATRISFPPTANPALTPAPPLKVEPGVGLIAQSPVVDQFARARLGKSLIPKSVAQSVPTSQPATAQTPAQAPTGATNTTANPQPSASQPPAPPAPPAPQAPIPGRW